MLNQLYFMRLLYVRIPFTANVMKRYYKALKLCAKTTEKLSKRIILTFFCIMGMQSEPSAVISSLVAC